MSSERAERPQEVGNLGLAHSLPLLNHYQRKETIKGEKKFKTQVPRLKAIK